MACGNCNYKGFIETSVIRDGGTKSMISQCIYCRDIEAYSKRVQDLMNLGHEATRFNFGDKKEGPCQVLPFRRP